MTCLILNLQCVTAQINVLIKLYVHLEIVMLLIDNYALVWKIKKSKSELFLQLYKNLTIVLVARNDCIKQPCHEIYEMTFWHLHNVIGTWFVKCLIFWTKDLQLYREYQFELEIVVTVLSVSQEEFLIIRPTHRRWQILTQKWLNNISLSFQNTRIK